MREGARSIDLPFSLQCHDDDKIKILGLESDDGDIDLDIAGL
jgi:hypothetical protein